MRYKRKDGIIFISVSLEETNLAAGIWLCHRHRNQIGRYFQVIQDKSQKRAIARQGSFINILTTHN